MRSGLGKGHGSRWQTGKEASGRPEHNVRRLRSSSTCEWTSQLLTEEVNRFFADFEVETRLPQQNGESPGAPKLCGVCAILIKNRFGMHHQSPVSNEMIGGVLWSSCSRHYDTSEAIDDVYIWHIGLHNFKRTDRPVLNSRTIMWIYYKKVFEWWVSKPQWFTTMRGQSSPTYCSTCCSSRCTTLGGDT